MNEQAEQIALGLTEARAETLRIFDLAAESELHRSPGFGYRPIIWHLAHMGVFEAYWLLQKLCGRPPLDERYERVFDPIRTPREESKDLPTRREMEGHLRRVREGVLEALDRFDFQEADPLKAGGYIFQLVLEHERQHQETLCYLFQLLDPSRKTRPGVPVPVAFEGTTVAADEMVSVPAGAFVLGAPWDSFAYDNERPAHEVNVPAFRIARTPVTNGEYARFVEERGYERAGVWGEEGWASREKEGWQTPLYWRREGGVWVERRMFEEGGLRIEDPLRGGRWCVGGG